MGILGFGTGRIRTFYGGRSALVYKGRSDSRLNKTTAELLDIPGFIDRRRAAALRTNARYLSSGNELRLRTDKLQVYDRMRIADNVERLIRNGKREKASKLAQLGLLRDAYLLSYVHGFLNDADSAEIFVRSGDQVMFREDGIEKFMMALAYLSDSCRSERVALPVQSDPIFDEIGILYRLYRLNGLFLRRDLTPDNIIGTYLSDFFEDQTSRPKDALFRELPSSFLDIFMDYPRWLGSFGKDARFIWTHSDKIDPGMPKGALFLTAGCAFLARAAMTPLAPLLMLVQRRRHNMKMMEHYGLLAAQSRLLFSRHKVETEGLPSYLTDDDDTAFSRFHGLYSTLTYLKYHFPVPIEAAPQTAGFDPKKPNVVIMGDITEDDITLLREGARNPEANFLFLLHENWLKHYPLSGRPLRVKEALMFSGDALYKLRFDRTQAAGYLLDFCELYSDTWTARNIPMASNDEAEELMSDKAKTFKFLEERGFKNIPKTWVIRGGLSITEVREMIYGILSRTSEIVIKPVDGSCGSNVAFFNSSQPEMAVNHALRLGSGINSIIVQERILPPVLKAEGQALDWNLRVFVSKNRGGRTVVSDIAVRYDGKSGPVNISLGAKVMTFDELAAKLKLDSGSARRLRKGIVSLSVKAFTAVEDEAKKIAKRPRPWREQDFMGVDIIIKDEGGSLNPYIIELNGYHSGGMWDLDQVAQKDKLGRSSRDFVNTMVRKAKTYG